MLNKSFSCEICNYKTHNKYCYKKHMTAKKHIKNSKNIQNGNIELLPNDIIYEIIDHSDLNSIKNLWTTSKKYYYTIKDKKLIKSVVYFNCKYNEAKIILSKFNFLGYILSEGRYWWRHKSFITKYTKVYNSNSRGSHLKFNQSLSRSIIIINLLKRINFNNCKYLDLTGANIYDKNLKKIMNCKTLILDECYNLTDVGMELLQNCNSLSLNYLNITDKSLESLNNCNFLSLCSCRNITDKGIKNLKNCKVLNLSHCYDLTDNGIKHLTFVKYLNLMWCYKITDKSVECLESCEYLNLTYCENVTFDSLNKLINLKHVYVHSCNISKDEILLLKKKMTVFTSYMS